MPNKIILATDDLSREKCLQLTREIGSRLHAVKIHTLYDEYGPPIVEHLRRVGAKRVWVDAKLFDDLESVRLRVRTFALSGADILTVHARGKIPMMQVAVEAFPGAIYAVTLLPTECDEQLALSLAKDAKLAGVYGVTCPAKYLGMLREKLSPSNLELISSGIPSIENGASYIVLGKEITNNKNPIIAFENIEATLE